jgi:hypothetical protein
MSVLKYKRHEGNKLICTNVNSKFMCISCFVLFKKGSNDIRSLT